MLSTNKALEFSKYSQDNGKFDLFFQKFTEIRIHSDSPRQNTFRRIILILFANFDFKNPLELHGFLWIPQNSIRTPARNQKIPASQP
jgi:hypothetical protein